MANKMILMSMLLSQKCLEYPTAIPSKTGVKQSFKLDTVTLGAAQIQPFSLVFSFFTDNLDLKIAQLALHCLLHLNFLDVTSFPNIQYWRLP